MRDIVDNTQPTNQSATPQTTLSNSTVPISNYQKGSFLHRAVAYLLDIIIIGLLGAIVNIIASLTKIQALSFLNYLIGLVYSIVFIGTNGATPGMKLLKLKVVTTNYQKISVSTAAGRTLAGIVSGIALNLGYYWMLIDRRRQTWHDKLANTYVVKLDDHNNLIPTTTEEVVTTGQKVLFWLCALLLPSISILAIILAIMLIAINPAKQFAQANNVKRTADITAIENAISKYKTDHNDQLPEGISNTPEDISSKGANLCAVLVPNYIVSLPADPLVNNGQAVSDCQSAYDTGYTISVNVQEHVTVSAPKAELNTSVSITR